MADIYKLAQQISRERNPFETDNFSNVMQVLSFMQTSKDKLDVSNRQQIFDLASLTERANNLEALENVQNMTDNLHVGSKLQPNKDFLNSAIENKTAQYNASLPAFKKVSSSFGLGDPSKDKYNFTVDKILNLKIDDTPEGKAGIDFLTSEIEETGIMMHNLKNAIDGKFNYSKYSNVPLQSAYDKVKIYNDTLQETMKAVPGGISPEEANVIFFGDYAEAQKKRLSSITSSMSKEQTKLSSLKRKLVTVQNDYRKELARAKEKSAGMDVLFGDEFNKDAFAPVFTEEEKAKGAPEGDAVTFKDITDFYTKEIDSIENSDYGTMKAYTKEYNFWSPSALPDVTKGKVGHVGGRLKTEGEVSEVTGAVRSREEMVKNKLYQKMLVEDGKFGRIDDGTKAPLYPGEEYEVDLGKNSFGNKMTLLNSDMDRWFEQNPTATDDEVTEQLKKLKKEFGLDFDVEKKFAKYNVKEWNLSTETSVFEEKESKVDTPVLTDEFTKNQARMGKIEENLFKYRDEAGDMLGTTDYTDEDIEEATGGAKGEFGLLKDELSSLEQRNEAISGQMEKEQGMLPPVIVEGKKVEIGEDVGDLSKVKEGILDSDISKTVTAIGGAYGVAKTAPLVKRATVGLAKMTAKSAKHISSATRMSNENITNFLQSSNVDATIKKIQSLENKISDATARGAKGSADAYKKQLNKLIKDRSKTLASTYKVRPQDIERLLDAKNRNKWNIFKAKRNITTRFPKLAKGIGAALIYGDIVDTALGTDMGTAEKLATGYATEKMVVDKFLPKVKKMITSKKGRDFLIKKVGRKGLKTLGSTVAKGRLFGGYGVAAAGVAGTYLAAMDIYNAIMNYKEEGTE